MTSLWKLADKLSSLDRDLQVVYGGDVYARLGATRSLLVPGEISPIPGEYGVIGMDVRPPRIDGALTPTVGDLLKKVEEATGKVHLVTKAGRRPEFWKSPGSTLVYATRDNLGSFDRMAVFDVVEGDGRVILVTHDISEYLRHIVSS